VSSTNSENLNGLGVGNQSIVNENTTNTASMIRGRTSRGGPLKRMRLHLPHNVVEPNLRVCRGPVGARTLQLKLTLQHVLIAHSPNHLV
jgi:hypothetical protein